MNPINTTSRFDDRATLDEKILLTAIQVFNEYGYYKTSVNEIADRLEIGKATIYRHFGNKIRLFIKAFNFMVEQLFQDFDKGIGNKNFRDSLDFYLELLMDRNRQWGRFLSESVHEQITAVARREIAEEEMKTQIHYMKMINQRFLDNIVWILEKGIATGELPGEVQTGICAEIIHSTTLNYLRYISLRSKMEKFDHEDFDKEVRFMQMKEFLYRGIGLRTMHNN